MKHEPFCIIGLLFILQFSPNVQALSADIDQKQKLFAYIDGDFIIGALFPIHEQPSLYLDSDPLVCGAIREEYGIQRVEAALFAIDAINNNTDLLPGITLGINIKDACWSESIALSQAMQLIEEPGMIKGEIPDEGICSRNSDIKKDGTPLIGIVGPASTEAVIHVQNLLKVFKIPQIGYSATSTVLENDAVYPYFFSVVPSDLYQVSLILGIMKMFKWSYMSIIYTDNSYGQNGMSLLESLAPGFELCIEDKYRISPTADEFQYYTLVSILSSSDKSKVVVCFCEEISVEGILRNTKLLNTTGKFQFLGSDGWASKRQIVRDYPEQALGSITVGLDTIVIKEFEEYYLQKNPKNNARNPWFKEFWEAKFNCELTSTGNSTLPRCTGKERLEKQPLDEFKVSHIIGAIFAFAYALHDMQMDVCVNETGPCNDLRPFNTTKFKTYLENVEFPFYNETMRLNRLEFNNTIKYNIYNFKKFENGKYDYVQVGKVNESITWYEYRRKCSESTVPVKLSSNIQFQNGSAEPLKSFCTDPCSPGTVKLLSPTTDANAKCCWNCVPCASNEVIHNSTTCKVCEEGFWPHSNKSECYKLREIYSEWTDLQSIISLFFAMIGIVLTAITACIFVKYKDTPVVKSSTRELSFMMLLGMVMAHSVVFVLVSKPTILKCTIVRTLLPISFTIMYGSLLVKTSRIARLLAMSKKKFPNLRPRFMSLQAQIVITLILIAIEVMICFYANAFTSLVLEEKSIPPYGIKILCPSNLGYLLTKFSFVGILVLLCTVFAVKTRNLPHNFNEAKFIGFAMYASCITWTAFSLVFFGGGDFKVFATCICASANSLVLLVFLFFPKLYIIIWVPEKNTRANFSTAKRIRCIIGKEDSFQDLHDKKKVYRVDSDSTLSPRGTENKDVTFSFTH